MDRGERARTTEMLRGAMLVLQQLFPGQAVVLMVAPIGVEGAEVSYISNVRREDMLATMKDVTGGLEGRSHNAPATIQ